MNDFFKERDEDSVDIKSYSLAELAEFYGRTPKTLRQWIKPYTEEIGKIDGRYLDVRQVLVIFKHRGWPVKKE